MSYQVLARKYRPRSFAELVGQEQVARALRHALDQNRLHHAYLFTGTRGVGKTTVARILARCLNCEKGISATPCGECSACRAISEGRFMDLIEVDAASRTGIDDTRELLENVQYAPSVGRFKVYLIDEVHMLSTSSFNALLKTLEEPPPHVKFLLATTDPQKLPITVLSRCLQFNLKVLPPDLVASHLAKLLEQENVPFEAPALALLGRAAQGSMRDALSLTDQAIAFGDGRLVEAQVRAMLGSVDREHVLKVLKALAEGKPAGLLATLDDIFSYHPDALALLDDLVNHLHQLAVAQILPERGSAEIVGLAARFTAEQLQLYYDIALRGRANLAQMDDGRSGFEMLLLRMLVFTPEGVLARAPATDAAADGGTVSAKKSQAAEAAAPAAIKIMPVENVVPEPAAPEPAISEPAPEPAAPEPALPESAVFELAQADLAALSQAVPAQGTGEAHHEGGVALPEPQSRPNEARATPPPASASVATTDEAWWWDLLKRLPLEAGELGLAANSRLISRKEGHWQLVTQESHRLWVTAERCARVEQAVSEYFGKPARLEWQFAIDAGNTPAFLAEQQRTAYRAALRASVVESAEVKALLAEFDGRLLEDSIRSMQEEPHHGF